ncbi:MAG: CehA/McbA family metallohydrolase [Gemmatimonadetes bacterium]|nr:CehA/McbA family metallohydrolase [Gemmatimonadota bacterium]
MASRGWYSGDNHIHPNYGGHYDITPEDLRAKARAEDLNVANGTIANYWGNSRVEDLEHFLGHPHPHPDPQTVVYYNEEYRPGYFAHMSLLNLTELITPFYIGSRGTATQELYPDNAAVLRRVHDQGGIGGYVHPYGLRHRDPIAAGAGSARELPIDAALGLADFVDVACIWSDELGTAAVWYKLLNTGSRIPATAGTDAMTDIWRHPAVGTTRSYVYTGEPVLDYDEWADAMAAGHAFVTSGPILTFDVSGRRMGEEVQVDVGDRVAVSVTAQSLFVMDRLEIVHNGQVIHAVDATGDRKTIEAALDLDVESSGWIAARVLGPPQHGAMDSYLFAHTNPVFVIADGQPIRSADDAAFFVDWIDQMIDEIDERNDWNDPDHKAQVLATFREARGVYQAQVGGR